MKKKLKLSTFQIGTPAKRGQGIRVGTTRRPPRGVPKERWTTDGYFDVWLPVVAPSQKLLTRIRPSDLEDPAKRASFFKSYERELTSNAEVRQTIEFLAKVAARTPISIGCFCEDESRCHRSRLLKVIQQHAE